MRARNIPSEYAIAAVIVIAFIAIVAIIVGTKKLTRDLEQIDVSVEKTKTEVESSSLPSN